MLKKPVLINGAFADRQNNSFFRSYILKKVNIKALRVLCSLKLGTIKVLGKDADDNLLVFDKGYIFSIRAQFLRCLSVQNINPDIGV
jgi:hypothetical protein